MRARAAALLATLGIVVAASAAADGPESWVCVPGDSGRWRCGQGSAELETSPLPALIDPASRTPALEAGQSTPSIFVLDRPVGRASPLELPAPDSVAGAAPLIDSAPSGAFALRIASVSRVEEIPAFVESFGLDPGLVRFVGIDEAGASRQVILWGAFSSAEHARRAIAGLPGMVRSVRPQVVRADGFANPPRALLAAVQPDRPADAADRIANADPRPAPAPRSPEPIAEPTELAARAEPATETAAGATAPRTREPAAESAKPPARTQRAMETALATAPAPRAREPIAEPADLTARPQAETEIAVVATAPSPALRAREPAESPERPQVAVESSSAAAAEPAQSAPSPRPANAKTHVPTPAASRPEAAPADAPIRARPAPGPPPGRGPEAFGQLVGDAYTVQLTSLREPTLIARYLRRHQLDPSRVYRLKVDEGAGPRWLLLWGAYPSLEQAEVAREALPGTVRSPWVRRIEPLKARLGLQSDP